MQDATPRILFVADKFGYPGGVAYGGTTYFLNVLPELARAGIEFTACFLRDPHPIAGELVREGIKPVFLGARRMDPTVFLRLASVARKHRSTVIHATGIKAGLMARMAAMLVPAKVIVHVHDTLHPGFLISNLHRWFARPSDIGLCVSRAVEPTVLDGYHVRRDRIRVIHNGIQLDKFRNPAGDTRDSVRHALGIAPQARVIGMIARMYPVKGHQAMLRMMPDIVARVPDALLLLVGDGTEREACERIVSELGLGAHVLFLGQRGDVAQILSACELTVMPSESEGLPLSAVESLAMGKPIVAYDVGGLKEVIDDDVTGCLLRYGDTASFCEAVVSLLGDEARLAVFSARAREAAERFDVERHVRLLIECYREQAATIA